MNSNPFVGPPSREDLQRRLNALRSAARYRNPSNRRRHFAHEATFRASFVKGILDLRQQLRG